MRFKVPLILAGVATGLTAFTAVSAAERPRVHVMTVALPGGGVEQIRYTGDHPPRIVVRDAAAPIGVDPFFLTAFGPDSPFAMLDRISAQMDRQAAMMMRQAQIMASQPLPGAGLHSAALANMPAGASSYTLVSTSSGNGVCTQSVSITSMGKGEAPKVLRKTSGDCNAAAKPSSTLIPASIEQPVQANTVPHDSI